MDHMYVTLPSNSSEDVFGRQPMSDFQTQLSQPMSLSVTDYEVGLAEIIYPRTWYHIHGGKLKIKTISNTSTRWIYNTVYVPSGHYDTPEQLISAVNRVIQDVLKDQATDPETLEVDQKILEAIQFHYHPLHRKVFVAVSEGFSVQLYEELSIILGFGDKQSTFLNTGEEYDVVELAIRTVYNGAKIQSPFTMDLDRGLHTLFVYCDLVQPQAVGDTDVPLLRAVGVEGQDGNVVTKSFQNIHYLPLNRSTFQTIHIYITDDTGRRVPFLQGRVIVKLHFRRKP